MDLMALRKERCENQFLIPPRAELQTIDKQTFHFIFHPHPMRAIAPIFGLTAIEYFRHGGIN
jgi:hypothetical protein